MASERLMDLLLAEINVMEKRYEDAGPISGGEEDLSKGRSSGKERIEAIAQVTRTLEKLIDVKRIEVAATANSATDLADAERARDELLRRLKLLDRQRSNVQADRSSDRAKATRPRRPARGKKAVGVCASAAEPEGRTPMIARGKDEPSATTKLTG